MAKPASSAELLSLVREIVKPLPLFDAKSKSQLEALRKKHKFPESFPMRSRLRAISREARDVGVAPITFVDPVRRELVTRRTAASAEELKRFLRRVQDGANKVAAIFSEASDDELGLLMYGRATAKERSSAMKDATVKPLFTLNDFNQLRDILARLTHAASEASKVHFDGGRRIDPYATFVAQRLRQLFLDAFGPNAPRITGMARRGSAVVAEKYSGPFLDFMGDILPFFGIQPVSNKALGELCSKAIRTVDGKRPPRETRSSHFS